ncbi:hypothetical protein ACQ4PT_027241 [Festuca glaucescens]
MGLNDHEAGGSSARGASIRCAAPRPQSLNADEAAILAEARLLVPPYWHLRAGWRVSTAGYAIPPVPEDDADLVGYIRHRRAALTPWDRANPDWGEDNALWRPLFEVERVAELANQYEMDEEGCLICGQPDTNCFRSKRRAFSFDVAMVHLFEELIALPCHAREMLHSLVDKWVVAECNHGSVYHFHVEKTEARTYLCGPFWSSFVDAYLMDENDIVEFTYDETTSKFEVVVFNADRDEKPWVQLPGMFLNYYCDIVFT